MGEAGVDIPHQKSQHIDEFKDTKIDYVITVCAHAHESCPFFPGDAKVLHVGFDDSPKLSPADASEEVKVDGFRRVRDENQGFVETLPEFFTK